VVVAEAADGEETVRLAQNLRPDIVVLDISMPRLNGIQVGEILRRTVPETRIVVLTGYDDNEQYAKALWRLGVRGYLSKTSSSRELATALRSVYSSRLYFQPSIANLLNSSMTPLRDEPTPREMEVLNLVAEGKRNRDIARQLHTSERTVQFHLANLFDKLQVASRTEMVYKARQRGWIT
jgi:two-component system, NarL family, response regulator LiaR